MPFFQRNGPISFLSRRTLSTFEEACWALSIQLSTLLPQKPRRVLFTSALPAEGKTTVAVNLAVVLAQKGERVLLLEADLRHPSLSQQLHLPASSGGLAAILEHAVPCAKQTLFMPDGGFFLIPAGIVQQHPMALLSSPLMIKTLEKCSKKYDWVLIDSPAICSFGDACVLGCQTDGAVMIVRQGSTAEADFQTAHEHLIRAGVHVLGCVLNDCLRR